MAKVNVSYIAVMSQRMDDNLIVEAGRTERHYWLALPRAVSGTRMADLSVRYKQTIIGVLWALIRLAASPDC